MPRSGGRGSATAAGRALHLRWASWNLGNRWMPPTDGQIFGFCDGAPDEQYYCVFILSLLYDTVYAVKYRPCSSIFCFIIKYIRKHGVYLTKVNKVKSFSRIIRVVYIHSIFVYNIVIDHTTTLYKINIQIALEVL